MARRVEIAEIELEDGSVLDAEVLIADGMADVAAWNRFRAENLKATLESATRWAVNSVKDAVPEQPDSLGIEFGLKLAVKNGNLSGVLAQASGEPSLTVKLQWNRPVSTD